MPRSTHGRCKEFQPRGKRGKVENRQPFAGYFTQFTVQTVRQKFTIASLHAIQKLTFFFQKFSNGLIFFLQRKTGILAVAARRHAAGRWPQNLPARPGPAGAACYSAVCTAQKNENFTAPRIRSISAK